MELPPSNLLCFISQQLFFTFVFIDMKMMFEPLAPLEFKIPVERHPLPAYSGVSQFASLFESEEPPKPKPFETPTDRKTKAKERLQKQHKERNELLVNEWDPHNNPKATE